MKRSEAGSVELLSAAAATLLPIAQTNANFTRLAALARSSLAPLNVTRQRQSSLCNHYLTPSQLSPSYLTPKHPATNTTQANMNNDTASVTCKYEEQQMNLALANLVRSQRQQEAEPDHHANQQVDRLQ